MGDLYAPNLARESAEVSSAQYFNRKTVFARFVVFFFQQFPDDLPKDERRRSIHFGNTEHSHIMQTESKTVVKIPLPEDEGTLFVEIAEGVEIPPKGIDDLNLNKVTFRHEDHHGVTLTRLPGKHGMPGKTVLFCQHCGLRLSRKVKSLKTVEDFQDTFQDPRHGDR